MKPKYLHSIAFRLLMAITICGAVIFAVVFSINYIYSARIAERKAEAHAGDIVAAAVSRIDNILYTAVKEDEKIAALMDEGAGIGRHEIISIIKQHVSNYEEVFGSAIAFEPGVIPGATPLFAPYYFKRNNKLYYRDLATREYDYRTKSWYTEPRKLAMPVWSEPYYDEGGGDELMTTYSFPLYRTENGARQFAGVAMVDVSINWLGKLLAGMKLHDNGYAVLLSQKGSFLAGNRPTVWAYMT